MKFLNVCKKIIWLLVLTILISGCNEGITGQSILCSYPYELIQGKCCIDKDNNSVCDGEETNESETSTLKDNINFDHVDNKLISYTLIGVCFLSMLLGILIVIELLFFPFIMQSMSIILLILCGVVLFLILLYKNYNKRR